MFSGYLQAGAYSGLDGKYGKQGWQVRSNLLTVIRS